MLVAGIGVSRIVAQIGAIQVIATLDAAAGGYQVVEARQLVKAEAERQAQFAQVAVGAGNFDGVWGHARERVGSPR